MQLNIQHDTNIIFKTNISVQYFFLIKKALKYTYEPTTIGWTLVKNVFICFKINKWNFQLINYTWLRETTAQHKMYPSTNPYAEQSILIPILIPILRHLLLVYCVIFGVSRKYCVRVTALTLSLTHKEIANIILFLHYVFKINKMILFIWAKKKKNYFSITVN